MFRRCPGSPLFPYTTLFRSRCASVTTTASRCCVRCSMTTMHWHNRCGWTRPTRCTTAARHQYMDGRRATSYRSEEHTSELQSRRDLVCRLLLEKKNDILVASVLDPQLEAAPPITRVLPFVSRLDMTSFLFLPSLHGPDRGRDEILQALAFMLYR